MSNKEHCLQKEDHCLYHAIRESCPCNRNTCPQCFNDQHAKLRNYDPIWRDGEVYCTECNIKIRSYDAG